MDIAKKMHLMMIPTIFIWQRKYYLIKIVSKGIVLILMTKIIQMNQVQKKNNLYLTLLQIKNPKHKVSHNPH
jgi:hypothetical protein